MVDSYVSVETYICVGYCTLVFMHHSYICARPYARLCCILQACSCCTLASMQSITSVLRLTGVHILYLVVFMHDLHVCAESYRRVHTVLSGYLCMIRMAVLSLTAV